MNRKRGHKRIFLIGSGRPRQNLSKRKKLQEILQNPPFDYNVFLMEEYPDPSAFFIWSEKFIYILKSENPDLVLAIFPKKSKHGAVEWELGILAHRHQKYEEFIHKVVLTLEKKTSLKELSIYSQQLVNKHVGKFKSWGDLPKTIDKLYKLRFY